jgi:hypothetical protein
MKSLQETYNYLLATNVADPTPYQGLQAQALRWAERWQQGVPGYSADDVERFVMSARDLSMQLGKAATSAGIVQGRSPQARADELDDIKRELFGKLARGEITMDAAAETLLRAGADIIEVQELSALVGHPEFDPGALPVGPTEGEGESPLPFLPGEGGSDFKPREDVAPDTTDLRNEFEKGFSLFTRQLGTSGTGQAPNLAVLTERYQDLMNAYMGELEARKGRGEEAENIFKLEYANIGKSTDPQFDQTTDRLQLRTVRPKLSVFDFLAQNVDPEDLYQSTPFEQRPGRSQGGYTGYVRRLNR